MPRLHLVAEDDLHLARILLLDEREDDLVEREGDLLAVWADVVDCV